MDANPQVANGHLDIANELVEQFAKHNITGQEWRIIWTIWRKTWCWKDGDRKKDFDWISITQFEQMTGMKRRNVHSSLQSLLAKRLILVSQKANGNLLYGFNQQYNEWLLAKRLTLANRLPAISQKATEALANRLNTKDTITKDTYTKESYVRAREIIKKFNCEDKINYNLFVEKHPTVNDEALKDILIEIISWREGKNKKKEITTNQVFNWIKKSEEINKPTKSQSKYIPFSGKAAWED